MTLAAIWSQNQPQNDLRNNLGVSNLQFPGVHAPTPT